MVFCNLIGKEVIDENFNVTILILIDGFLQSLLNLVNEMLENGHNPYFNRWFSAIINTNSGLFRF